MRLEYGPGEIIFMFDKGFGISRVITLEQAGQSEDEQVRQRPRGRGFGDDRQYGAIGGVDTLAVQPLLEHRVRLFARCRALEGRAFEQREIALHARDYAD